MSPSGVQPRLLAGLVWRVVAELYRRHHRALDLTVVQADPGGGRGDVLALYRRGDQRLIVGFDLAGSAMVSAGPVGAPRTSAPLGLTQEALHRWRYPAFLVRTPTAAAADALDGLLGLPRGGAPDDGSASALVFDVMARLLSRTALEPRGVVVRCGWEDRAGGGGSSQAAWTAPLLDHPPFGELELPAGVPWPRAAAEVAHLWGLFPARPPEGPLRPRAILSTDTGQVFDGRGVARGDLWARFERGESPVALAARLERLVTA